MYEIKCSRHNGKPTIQLEMYKKLFEQERVENIPFNETLKGVDRMIDTKAFMEACQKRVDLFARIYVQQELAKIAMENAEKCRLDRNFSQCQAWIDTGREIAEKLVALTEELKKITELIETM